MRLSFPTPPTVIAIIHSDSVNVQYNDGFLPDIIILLYVYVTNLGNNPIKAHEGSLSFYSLLYTCSHLKRCDFPAWECPEGSDAFRSRPPPWLNIEQYTI